MNRLTVSLRWAFAVMWVASAAWLAGCMLEVLGWRGPGDFFLAWSVPALPVFVATADWWSRRRGGGAEPWLAAVVAGWASVLWWFAAAPPVPGSPGGFVAASGTVLAVGLAVLAAQALMLLNGGTHTATTPIERRIAVATSVGLR